MVDVFISYPRPQRRKAELIRERLEALGLEVFFDVHGIDGGAEFPDVIDKKLRACKVVLSCWSPLYFERRWCMIECRVGLDKRALVPVSIEAFSKDLAPADLRFVNYYDLTTWRGGVRHEDWLRTLRALSQHVGRDLCETPSAREGTGTRAPPNVRPPRAIRNNIRPPARVAPLPESALPDMVSVLPGGFQMGLAEGEKDITPYETPQHEVQIDYTFALGRFPVTFAQWDAARLAGAKLPDASDEGSGRGRRPVVNVSWQDAHAYTEYLNLACGLNDKPDRYRLPSESEWERACRANTVTRFSFGDDELSLEKYAWFRDNSDDQVHPVGLLRPNALGLYDIHGNVWEWCEDAWHNSYKGAPLDGSPRRETLSGLRVLRGGCWGSLAHQTRSTYRIGKLPTTRDYGIGFRVARSMVAHP